MPRRYWLPIIAVVGLILAAQQGAEAQGRQHSAAQAQPAPKRQSQPSIPPALQSSLDRIGSALESANNKPEAKDEQKRADENLAAQWQMVRWAKWMFAVGIAETAITFAGVLLVMATLIYSRDAARAAQEAVIEAKAATKVAREVGEAQVRAYVTVKSANANLMEIGGEPSPTFNFVVVNAGQSPARHFVWTAKIQIYEKFMSLDQTFRKESDDWPPDWQQQPGYTIAAGGEQSLGTIAIGDVGMGDVIAKSNGIGENAGLQIRVDFEYLDVFDRKTVDKAFFEGRVWARGKKDPPKGMLDSDWVCDLQPVRMLFKNTGRYER